MSISLKPALNNPLGGYSVVFSLDKNYLRPALTLIESIVAHSESSEVYNFFILHEDISSFSQRVVENYVVGLKAYVCFINLAERKIKGPILNHYTKAMYYRLLIPSLFKNWERILYLDVDILALSNITSIFHMIGKDKAIAATKDSFPAVGHAETVLKSGKASNYFNSGVMVFNCQNISEKDLSDCLENIGKYPSFPDQDILNYVYEGRVHYLSHKAHFLLLDGSAKAWETMRWEDRIEREKVTNPILIHYGGAKKPWLADLKNNHQGYSYYDEYRKVREITDKKLEKIFLEVASLEFP